MLAQLDQVLGEKVAEKWPAWALMPSFVFWVGGLACWAARHPEGWAAFLAWLGGSTQVVQAGLLILGLFVVVSSGVVAQQFSTETLRLFEGYWPRWAWPLRRLMSAWAAWRLKSAAARFQQLEAKRPHQLSPAESDEHARLDWQLIHTPALPQQLMPTRLGNILRAAETRPANKYGLDVIICWPRLWLLLSEETRAELAASRATLDAAAHVCFWGLLSLIWCLWSWWAVPVGLLITLGAYRRMLAAGEVYGSLLESAFDVHRVLLYQSLRWPLPRSPAEERQSGAALTAYLWRGSEEPTPVFTSPAETRAAEPGVRRAAGKTLGR